MTDIFLSYSAKNRHRVKPLRDSLAARGHDVFWDVRTPIGENWDQWIRKHLEEARLVLVFWTKDSAASVNVQHEAAIARETNKLLPVVLEVMKAVELPMGFYTTQASQLQDWDGSDNHPEYIALLNLIEDRLSADGEAQRAETAASFPTNLLVLERRAAEGDANAQAELGYRYFMARGVMQSDEMAVKFWLQACEQGNARAQNNLAVMYRKGLGGLVRDVREAARLFKLSAGQGNGLGQNNLGTMYARGEGDLKQDTREATRLYKLSAEQGNALGQTNLAHMYFYGLGGMPTDEAKAIELWKLAARQGQGAAQRALTARAIEW